MNAPQLALGLTDQLYGLVKALVVLFHFRQQTDTAVQRACVHGELHALICGSGGFFLPLLHPQRVAADDIRGGLRLVTGILQRPPVGLGLSFLFRQLLFRGGLVRLRRKASCFDLLILRPDGGGLRLGVCGGCRRNGFPAP